jgi:membrane protein YqaA with SNARE-associated domain
LGGCRFVPTYSTWALFILTFCEPCFFPIPLDVLVIGLAEFTPIPYKPFIISKPEKVLDS